MRNVIYQKLRDNKKSSLCLITLLLLLLKIYSHNIIPRYRNKGKVNIWAYHLYAKKNWGGAFRTGFCDARSLRNLRIKISDPWDTAHFSQRIMSRHILFILYLSAFSWAQKCPSRREKRAFFGPEEIDLEKVRNSVISPSSISNQLTGQVIFNWVAYPIAYSLLGESFSSSLLGLWCTSFALIGSAYQYARQYLLDEDTVARLEPMFNAETLAVDVGVQFRTNTLMAGWRFLASLLLGGLYKPRGQKIWEFLEHNE